MNFRPELAEKVMRGEKTRTRRLVSDNPRSPWWRDGCALKIGGSYAVCPGRGKNQIGRLYVLGVTREPLGLLTEYEAVQEGFDSVEEFTEAWAQINGSYDPDALVWCIEFEVY